MAQTEGSCFFASYIRSTEDSYSGENTHQVTTRVIAVILKKRLSAAEIWKLGNKMNFLIDFLLNVWNGVAIIVQSSYSYFQIILFTIFFCVLMY